jgi:hypothetical protein
MIEVAVHRPGRHPQVAATSAGELARVASGDPCRPGLEP